MGDFSLGLFAGLIFWAMVLAVIVKLQVHSWEEQAKTRGYSEYCQSDGSWAWKGECDKE